MKRKILLISLIIGFTISFIACDNDEELEKGKVLFYTNSYIINCVFDIKISIDNEIVGYLNASTIFHDTVCQCENSKGIGLLLNIDKGTYSYTANEVNCIATNKVNTWTGQFEVNEDDCTEIFLDINKP